jgi:hypothetical protein
MKPNRRPRLILAAVAPLIPLLLLAASPAEEAARVSGTYTMTYSQRHPVPVTDTEGHIVIATEAKGTNRSTGAASYMDGADVSIAETADMVQGNGPHQGYATMSLKGDLTINQWSGKLSTVLGPDKQPVTSFKGTWTSVKGHKGHGTYQGRITGPDTYTVEWQGEVELKSPTASR